MSSSRSTEQHWLMKAEPDPRIVKGKDVKFSVDDFESVRTTAWEGVRNHEAKNLMKEMKLGDKVTVLFYHSNCKLPGIAAFAEVSKEAHPDYTAWDTSHPYYDAKTDKANPKWFMVEVTLSSRAKNFVPLALMRHIAASIDTPNEVSYIGEEGVKAIKAMALVNRGRLSVQRVNVEAWSIVELMAEKGGWEDMTFGKGKAISGNKETPKVGGGAREKKAKTPKETDTEQQDAGAGSSEAATGRKRKAVDNADNPPPRRSTRTKT